jgi:hypothetical protein
MSLNKKYRNIWIVWILAFFAIEGFALRNNKVGDTLSENIREWIGTNNPSRTWAMWILRIGLGGLLIWAVPHFYTGSV